MKTFSFAEEKSQEEVNVNPKTEGSARKMTSSDANTRQMLERNLKLHHTRKSLKLHLRDQDNSHSWGSTTVAS